MDVSKQNTVDKPVLILAAGYGRRMGPFSRMVNKCLVPYDNKPLLSHIIDKFDKSTHFVIACGYLGQQVKDYISLVHADKNITIVDIPSYSEDSTGPATTIRYCANYIRNGCIWVSCDTLFDIDFHNKLDHNWIAVHPVNSDIAQDYCWIDRDGNNITGVHNKESSADAVDAFIGLMHVTDSKFIDNLMRADAKEVYKGFSNLNLKAYTVGKWQDFGTYEKWKLYNNQTEELSFPKPDEIFYSDNSKIIKFNIDASLSKLKYERAKSNTDCMPRNPAYVGNFFSYDYVPGTTLYSQLDLPTFKKFMGWANNSLWKPAESNPQAATKFYKDKTLARLSKFRTKYNSWVEYPRVNNIPVKTIEEYISEINFTWLTTESHWCYIHGDLQFDNIIFSKDTSTFTAIDWRSDFAGDPNGDIYYDLAKMLGGLYLSYKSVKDGLISYTELENEVIIHVPSVQKYEIYISALQEWVISKNLDWKKVQTLVPIIYLNMAPLHEAPFDKYLIALAQLHFAKL